jgi:cytochrome P450
MTAELPEFPFPVGPRSEPPPEYARLREQGCPQRVRLRAGGEALVVTRYDDVRQVLSDRRFSRAAHADGPLFARSPESLPLVMADPPDHGRRRSAVRSAFSPRRVRALRPRIEQVAAELVGALAAGPRPADLVGGFTVPLALTVIGGILGLSAADLRPVKQWVDPMMSAGRYPPGTVGWGHRQLHEHVEAFVAGLEQAQAAGHRPPGLVAELLRSDSADLSRAEVVTLSAGLLVAGYETTGNQMGAAFHEVLTRPELEGRLRADPDHPEPVVEELLRYVGVNGTGGPPHVAMEDIPLADGVIRRGEVVVPVPDAANRDPAVFPEPDDLRPDRDRTPHLTFGFGPHYCLGADLARLELAVGIPAVLSAFPGLRIAVPEDDLRWRTDMLLRGLWELPITW